MNVPLDGVDEQPATGPEPVLTEDGPSSAPPVAVAGPASLPFTGVNAGVELLLSGSLLTIGFLMVLLARQPRGRHVLR